MADPRKFEVQHAIHLPKRFGKLLFDAKTSDITLKVEEEAIPAHRAILAASSDYFRALLYGNMKESNQVEIVLEDIPSDAFKLLLGYIYTGRMELGGENIFDTVSRVLGVAHLYDFEDLQAAICQYLSGVLSIQTACIVLQTALSHHLHDLEDSCYRFIDVNADAIMHTELFTQLSADALEQILSRDTFCTREIGIFKAVERWISKQSNDAEVSKVLEKIRLPLIAVTDLTNSVRTSGLFDSDRLLDAICEKAADRTLEMEWRGFVVLEKDIATPENGMKVLTGLSQPGDYCSGLKTSKNTGLLKHYIGDGDGIMIVLGRPYLINKISIRLLCSSSFYVEVSRNREDWRKIIDHSKYFCESTQSLHFEPHVVRYVRVVGTRSSAVDSKTFGLDSFKALYTQRPLKLTHGIPTPKENIASPQMGARILPLPPVTGFTHRNTSEKGFPVVLFESPLVVRLTQPFFVDSMRILLWDGEKPRHSYTVEVSADNTEWTRVASFTDTSNDCWQFIKFKPSVVVFIKVDTTRSMGTNFVTNLHKPIRHQGYVDIECPAVGQ